MLHEVIRYKQAILLSVFHYKKHSAETTSRLLLCVKAVFIHGKAVIHNSVLAGKLNNSFFFKTITLFHFFKTNFNIFIFSHILDIFISFYFNYLSYYFFRVLPSDTGCWITLNISSVNY